MLPSYFVIIGSLISVFGSLMYTVAIVKGKIKPHKVTLLLWSVIPFIAFFAQIKQGVGIQSLLTFVSGFMPLVNFVSSFLNEDANWEITKFDLMCGFLSIVGIILWLVTKVGNLAILFSIIADSLAAVPTVVKAYKHPETELSWTWLTSATGAALTLLTINKWSFANSSFAIYVVTVTMIVFVLVQFRIGIRKNLTD